MHRRTYALIVFLLLFTVACAQPAPQAPVEQTPQPEPSVDEIVTPPEPETAPIAQPNPKIEELTARANEVEGYKFTLARLPKKSAENIYWVKQGKVKVDLVTPRQMDGWSADYVFLDYARKTAYAYCIELTSCKKSQPSGGVPFADYAITLPEEWLPIVIYGEKGGQLTFGDRPVTVVTWEADGQYYEAYLDNFFGFPHRVAIATDEDMVNIIGGYEYQGLSRKVTTVDVTPPY